MKVAYIAHPISGDIDGNVTKLMVIVRKINLEEPDVVPFVPYFIDLLSLSDDVPEERARGIKNNTELMKREFVDEVRLYGSGITEGMRDEITLAKKLGIRVVPMTEETKRQYYKKLKL